MIREKKKLISSRFDLKIVRLPLLAVSGIWLLSGCNGSLNQSSGIEEYHIYDGSESIAEVWETWSNDNLLSVEFSPDVRVGERSLRVEYPEAQPRGYQDWTLQNRHVRLVDVEPGEKWTASAWVKYDDTERIGLEIMALSNGEPVSNWTSGFAAAYGTGDWELLQATAIIPPDSDQIYIRFSGSGKTLVWLDDVRLRRGMAERTAPERPEVRGWAFDQERVEEKIDRGLVAMPLQRSPAFSGRGVYLHWRLLKDDPDDIAFNVYRISGGSEPMKLNDDPVSTTTDFMDKSPEMAVENVYFVRPVLHGQELDSSEQYTVEANPDFKPYVSIKLDRDETTFHKVGIGDLNGDGRYDFVIKTPNTNIDPFYRYWRPSETTYQLEAYLSDGTFLWRKDLGWNIETGIWYSPFVIYDFNGDGRAEVAVKTGPMDEDYRDTEPSEHGLYSEAGRVRSGPEYVSILDGMTGQEQARADWPSRAGMGSYNHSARHQMGVAYLDGKTPSLLVVRGKYTLSKLTAFQFHEGELDELWSWDSTDEPGGLYYGQGDHFIHTVDVTGDGRDEIVIGAAVVGSNGEGLWSSGLGHPDNVWVGNIDPTRAGLEIYMGIEGARVKGSVQNGISLWDAETGELLWGLDQRTYHIHGRGLVSNIDSRNVGMEAYSGESGRSDRWLHTTQGKLLAREDDISWSTLSPATVYWDATPERELLVGNRIFKYPDQTISTHIEGSQAAWVDLFGDWREEIITSVPGELRIYMTPIPATDRRVTLIQDPLYRSGVAHQSMGYGQPALTSYYIGDDSLAISVTNDYEQDQKPKSVRLHQNYPNPFNPITTITWVLPDENDVTLTIYNVLGQKIKTLTEERLTAGKHRHTFNASRLTSGVYIYELRVNDKQFNRTMTVIK